MPPLADDQLDAGLHDGELALELPSACWWWADGDHPRSVAVLLRTIACVEDRPPSRFTGSARPCSIRRRWATSRQVTGARVIDDVADLAGLQDLSLMGVVRIFSQHHLSVGNDSLQDMSALIRILPRR